MKNIETILKDLGIEVSAEQNQSIVTAISENYKTIVEHDKVKTKLDTATQDLSKAKEDIKNIATEFEGKTAEDWKSEVDKIQGEWKAETDQRAETEKTNNINKQFETRFNAIAGDKKFINSHTKNGVLSEWRKAIENADNQGKGDLEIYTDITKDVTGLYQGVTAEVLVGGDNNTNIPNTVQEDIMRRAMGLPDKTN